MGDVILVSSGKGGVGKSTVCACLGREIADKGKKTVIVELDCGLRCLDIMLSVGERLVYDLSDVAEKRCSLSDAVVKADDSGNLCLLPAPFSADATISEEFLKDTLKALAAEYDAVLIDAPAGVGRSYGKAFRICDTVLMVVTPDPICIRDAHKTAKSLYDIGCRNIRLIINRVREDFQKNKTIPDLDYVIDTTQLRLIGVIPEDDSVPRRLQNGEQLQRSVTKDVMNRIAGRIFGEDIKLLIK